MSRYIDADRINWRLLIPTNPTTAEEYIIYSAEKLVERQPTADVVEVVRCKDCKYSKPMNGTDFIYFCNNGSMVSHIHFCAYGERRKGDKD